MLRFCHTGPTLICPLHDNYLFRCKHLPPKHIFRIGHGMHTHTHRPTTFIVESRRLSTPKNPIGLTAIRFRRNLAWAFSLTLGNHRQTLGNLLTSDDGSPEPTAGLFHAIRVKSTAQYDITPKGALVVCLWMAAVVHLSSRVSAQRCVLWSAIGHRPQFS